MFCCIVAGRSVQTDSVQIGETQFVMTIPDADSINHILVFLTNPLPIGMASSVYFSWPDPNAAPNWLLLGVITNSKPSALFKISKLKKHDDLNPVLQTSVFGTQPISHNAQIGVSVEPEVTAVQQTPVTTNTSTYLHFGQKMLENFFNYASSFAINQSQMVPNSMETFVPLSTLQTWYTNFERRLQQNPHFWK